MFIIASSFDFAEEYFHFLKNHFACLIPAQLLPAAPCRYIKNFISSGLTAGMVL
jgi:hypothetical protein